MPPQLNGTVDQKVKLTPNKIVTTPKRFSSLITVENALNERSVFSRSDT
jgi:hypothetical protein